VSPTTSFSHNKKKICDFKLLMLSSRAETAITKNGKQKQATKSTLPLLSLFGLLKLVS